MELVRAGDGEDEVLGSGPQTGPQAVGHVGMGLKAAGGDARADGGQDVPRAAAIALCHGQGTLSGRPGGGAPPSGVDGGDHPADRVIEQNGDAVPGEDGQAHPRLVGHQAVGGELPGQGGVGQHICPGDRADGGAVYLAVFHQSICVGTHSPAEAAEVLPHPGGVVPPSGPQIQTVPGCGGYAAQAGGKAVGRAAPAGVGTGIKGDPMSFLKNDLHGGPPLRHN